MPAVPEIASFSLRVRARVAVEGVYAPYVEQQRVALRSFERDENLKLPLDIDYDKIHGLSMEEKALLKVTRPESVGQARRIEGMTPNGAVLLLAHTRRKSKTKSPSIAWDAADARKNLAGKEAAITV
jgi:tRNA uridine 5-carboxymethylaminomethyl modification enzyme